MKSIDVIRKINFKNKRIKISRIQNW